MARGAGRRTGDLPDNHRRQLRGENDGAQRIGNRATLSEIDLNGFNPDTPEGKGSFTAMLSLHGVSKAVTGVVEIRQSGAGLRVKASFPVQLSDYSVRTPRYLGIGVKDTVQVEVAFAASR